MRILQALVSVVLFFSSSGTLLVAQAPGPPSDTVSIRAYDRIVTPSGEVKECLIADPNPTLGRDLTVKIRTVTTVLKAADIKEIIPRRSAEEAYGNWVKWLRKESRSATGSLKQGPMRAAAELALASWCRTPHVKLDGKRPMESMAHKHLVMAARADAGYASVYPYLLASFIRQNKIGQASLIALNEEIELYLRAQAAGYSTSDLDYRIAIIMSRSLKIPGGAVKYFERVLAAGEESSATNRSQRRKAREVLSSVYMRQGDVEKALGLYDELIQPQLTADLNFEGFYNSAIIYTRMGGVKNTALARDRFTKARDLQPGFAEIELRLAALDYASGQHKEAASRLKAYLARVPGDLQATIDSALVDITQGLFWKAEQALKKALDETGEPLVGMRARLGLGSIEELRGNLPQAEAYYRSAAGLAESNPLASLMLANILVGQGRADEAGELVAAVRSDYVDSQALFGVCSRLQALIENRSGDATQSSVHLEFAVDVSPEDPAVLEAAGLAFLRQGKLEQGLGYLTRANTLQEGRPATLNGLGYYNYIQGHHREAAAFFDQTLAALKKSTSSKKARPSAFARRAKVYAANARNLISDMERLQVWVDEFESSVEGSIDGWSEVELYGIDVDLVDSNIVFKGQQTGADDKADGESGIRLMRVYRSRDLERIAVRLRIDSGRVAPFLRLSGPDGERSALAALSIFRDFEGRVRVRIRTAKGDWVEPVEPTAEEEGSLKGALYTANVTWEDDSKFHTLEIRKARSEKGSLRSNMFDLYFDGEKVAQSVQVPGLSTKYQLSVMSRTDAIGNEYSVTVDNFKVYRAKGKRK